MLPFLRSRTAFLLGLALAVALHLALRLSFIDEPLERDEGFYATVAITLLDGGVPYRDAIDIKPPGITLLYALMIKLGGEQLAAIRIGSAIYSAFTLLALAGVATATRGRRVGLLAAALFAVFGATPLLMANSANTEVFLGLPLLLWMAGLLDRRSPAGALLAGCGAALAMLIKPVALPFVLLGLLLVVLHRPSGRSRLGSAALYLAPGLLLAGAVCGWFAARGAWAEFWHWNVEVPFSYAAGGFMHGPALGDSLRLYGSVLLPLTGFALPWGLVALWRQRRAPDAPEVLVAGALICGVLAFLMPGKNFAHYYAVIIPFACLATACLLDETLRWAAGAPAALPRTLAYGLLASWLAAFGLFVARSLPWHLGASGNDVAVNKYGSDLFVKIHTLGQLLGQLTLPGDTIYAWGFDPQIYFYSGRRPASRYIGNVLPAMDDRGTQSLAVLRRELERNRPRFIVIVEGSMDVIGVRELLAYVSQNAYQHRFDLRYFEGTNSYRIGVFERP